jgi:poly-gamma-glutamate capsule biosynthesis protein CapA/YwtB (metallophosphatase superfamily)
MSLTIGLVGDVMLGRGVGELLRVRAPETVWTKELRDLASACDVVIANLECCISQRGRPTSAVASKPFFFRAPPAAVDTLAALSVSAVSLANNHALDYGPDALQDTLSYLADAQIATVGAGYGPVQARRGAVLQVGSKKIGILGLCDHPEQYCARPGQWGLAYADLHASIPEWVSSEVARLRELCDFVIVFPHWGPNMTTSPASWQRSRARELAERGADLVAGHSAHLFHGIELLQASLCLYDLGDTCDDYVVSDRLRNDLGLFAIWRPEDVPRLQVVGLRLHYGRTGIVTTDDAAWLFRRLTDACSEFGTQVTHSPRPGQFWVG